MKIENNLRKQVQPQNVSIYLKISLTGVSLCNLFVNMV